MQVVRVKSGTEEGFVKWGGFRVIWWVVGEDEVEDEGGGRGLSRG